MHNNKLCQSIHTMSSYTDNDDDDDDRLHYEFKSYITHSRKANSILYTTLRETCLS